MLANGEKFFKLSNIFIPIEEESLYYPMPLRANLGFGKKMLKLCNSKFSTCRTADILHEFLQNKLSIQGVLVQVDKGLDSISLNRLHQDSRGKLLFHKEESLVICSGC